jgi:hypothetical protein
LLKPCGKERVCFWKGSNLCNIHWARLPLQSLSAKKKNVSNNRKGRNCIFVEKKEFVGRRVLISAISTRLGYLFIASLQRRRRFRITEKVVTDNICRKERACWWKGSYL